MIPADHDAARIESCPRCGARVLAAMADGALLVRADPAHIDARDELAVLLAGRAAFDVLIYGLPRRLYLAFRDVHRIRAGRKHPVVAKHDCGDRTELTLIAPWLPPEEISIGYGSAYPDIPPF